MLEHWRSRASDTSWPSEPANMTTSSSPPTTTRSVRQLLAFVDITRIAARYTALRCSGGALQGRCPIDNNDPRPLFFVLPSLQSFHCLGCGAAGTALDFLMKVERLNVDAASRRLREFAPGRQRPATVDVESVSAVRAALEAAARYYVARVSRSPEATDYLAARGINADTMARFGIGYAPGLADSIRTALPGHSTATLIAAGLVADRSGAGYADLFRRRIMFPIRDIDGRVIGFGGRVLGSRTPKYLNSPDTIVFHKGAELYGLCECNESDAMLDHIVVVEGYTDVIALSQHGIRQCVATLGSAMTADHIRRVFAETDHVVFCFDGDAAGRNAGLRALECAMPALRAGRTARFLQLPNNEDPDSFVKSRGPDAFLSLVEEAMSLQDYILTELAQPFDLRTLDGRASWLSRITPILVSARDRGLKTDIAEAIADRAGVSPSVVLSLVDTAQQKTVPSATGVETSARPSSRRPTL